MERTGERLAVARKSLNSLFAALAAPPSPPDIVRDAAIQRFEYTFEALWKAAQMYLREFEGIDAASPRGTIRACFRVDVLTHEEAEHALKMVDDRNLSVHTYNEALAESIFSRLPAHAALLARWLAAMTRNLSE